MSSGGKKGPTTGKFGNVTTGHAKSTGTSDQSIIAFFNRVMVAIEQPTYENMTEMDAEGDNLLVTLGNFADGIANQPLLKSNDEEYAAKTLVKYVERMALLLKERFKDGAACLTPENVLQLKNNTKKVANRRLERGAQEEEVISGTIPIFRQSSPEFGFFEIGTATASAEPIVPNTDLIRIGEQLLRSNNVNAPTIRLAYCLIYGAVGRPGEPKFVNYDKMFWATYFSILFAKWFQMKQITSIPTSICCDYSCSESCSPHAFGVFWSVGNGLARADNPYKKVPSAAARKASYVFPQWHNKSDQYVAGLLTKQLKELVPPSLKNIVTAKSLRIGASTLLAAHREVTFDESLVRGGWSSKTSRDHYVWVLMTSTMTAMYALAGYPIPTLPVGPPTLMALGEAEQPNVQKFIKELYIIHVPHFLPGAKLRGFLHMVTAVLIMHFQSDLDKYSIKNRHVFNMAQKMEKAGLAGSPKEAITRLCEWSQKIKAEFEERKVAPGEDQGKILERLRIVESKLAAANAARKKEWEASQLRDQETQKKLSVMQTTIDQMSVMVRALLDGQQLGNPSSSSRKPAPRPPAVAASSTGDNSTSSTTVSTSAAPPAAPPAAAAAAAPAATTAPPPAKTTVNPFLKMMFNAKAEQTQKASAAGISVSTVLQDYYEDGTLIPNLLNERCSLASFKVHPSLDASKNGVTFTNAMFLADKLLDKDQVVKLHNEENKDGVISVLMAVDPLVMRFCAILEDKQMNTRRKPFWSGIGSTITSHDPDYDTIKKASMGGPVAFVHWIEDEEKELKTRKARERKEKKELEKREREEKRKLARQAQNESNKRPKQD